MELRQLRAFVVVADELHFGRAAERLYLSKSALSDQIRALEHDVGAALFDRGHRSVTLTEAGRAFLVEAKRALADVEAARSAVRAVSEAPGSRLRLGWPAAGNPAWVETVYTDYRDAHPNVTLEPVIGHSAAHAEAIAEGTLDVAFVFGAQEAAAVPLEFQPLRRLTPRLACAASHPLASAPAITLAELRAATHVTMPREENPPLYRRLFEGLLDGAPRLVEHTTSLEAVLGVVATGDAVALRLEDRLPEVTREPLVYRRLMIQGLDVEFGLTWRAATRTPLAEEFCRFAITLSRLSDYLNRPDLPDGRSESRD